MSIHDLSPEARAAVAEWLRGLAAAHSDDPAARTDRELDCAAARAEALTEAAAELEGLGPAPLPFAAEVRTERLEDLPAALHVLARRWYMASPGQRIMIALAGGGSAVAQVLPGARWSGDLEQAATIGDEDATPRRVDGSPITGPVEVLSDPPGHCYPAEAHRVEVVDGVERFRRNRIVDDLVEAANARRLGPDLNAIAVATARGRYTREEHGELGRLVGYSLCGFADAFPAAEGE